MLTTIHFEDLIVSLGHDGSETFPGRIPPHNKRGFDLEEMKFALLKFGYLMVEYQSEFEARDPLDVLIYRTSYMNQINQLMSKYDGLLLGYFPFHNPHAVAWCAKERVIYDPNGPRILSAVAAIAEFKIELFIRIVRISNEMLA